MELGEIMNIVLGGGLLASLVKLATLRSTVREANAAAEKARAEADAFIDGAAGMSRAVFNLAGVRFMDSTGIGFLIGRYKRLKRYGMEMYLESPNAAADKILELGGLYSLMPKL